jgi:hypothetical protein
MKRTLLALALCAASGYAGAQYADTTLAPVIVEGVDGYRIVEDCTPPADAPECSGFHALIRANFNEREIGMLFGAATAYPEYRTSYSSVKERYDDLVAYVQDYGVAYALAHYGQPITVVEPATVIYRPAPAVYEETVTTIDDNDAVVAPDDPDAAVLRTYTSQPVANDDEDEYYDTAYDDDAADAAERARRH